MRPRIIIKYELTTICPYDKSVDYNNIEIYYERTATKLIEFIELAEFLESFRGKEIIHEDLAQRIWEQYKDFYPVVRVSSEFETLQGMRIEIEVGNLDREKQEFWI